MARRTVYRDYRAGKRGQFTNKAAYNRSRAQGVTCHIHREFVQSNVINDIDELFDMEDDEDLEPQEFHGTGNT